MSIELAEQLKQELSDKYVVVNSEVVELRRFEGLTGRVKTVNMNGRALVEFDGPVDISWYDIDPDFLTVVDAPLPKKKQPAKATKAAEKPKAKSAPTTGGKSPLEMARQQGAAGSSATAPADEKKLSPLELARQQGAAGSKPASAPSAPTQQATPPADEKKLSPLELARQQGAAGSKPASAPSAPTQQATPPADEKKLSPLELARQQGAAGSKPASEPEAPATETPADNKTSSESIPTTGPDGQPLSPLELARLQGPFKG